MELTEQEIQALSKEVLEELGETDPKNSQSAVQQAARQEDSSAVEEEQEGLAKYVDHTLLAMDATTAEIIKICAEARQYNFASVCVNPNFIELVAHELDGSGVKPCCVIGFPLGAHTPEVKAFETTNAVEHGAKEVDMVVNVSAIKDKNWELVQRDIESVVIAADGRALVKVIIEAVKLTDEEIVKVCTVAKLVGADFVKTSTGFSEGGATVPDVRLMRETVGQDLGVKASGGVRNADDARRMIEAGANRLGTSAGVQIATDK